MSGVSAQNSFLAAMLGAAGAGLISLFIPAPYAAGLGAAALVGGVVACFVIKDNTPARPTYERAAKDTYGAYALIVGVAVLLAQAGKFAVVKAVGAVLG